MSEELKEDQIQEESKEVTPEPIEVIIKKEETKPEPSFDYDDYLPTPEEIQETEKEIEKITLAKKVKT